MNRTKELEFLKYFVRINKIFNLTISSNIEIKYQHILGIFTAFLSNIKISRILKDYKLQFSARRAFIYNLYKYLIYFRNELYHKFHGLLENPLSKPLDGNINSILAIPSLRIRR